LNREPGAPDAEFALLVGDPWQHSGIGKDLLTLLIRVARHEKIRRIFGLILGQNQPMQDICRELGFHLRYDREEAAFEASLEA
jgi:acetyltransferase